jgi:type I restriction enzyme M protein
VPIGEIERDGFNLDRKNPSRADDYEGMEPALLLEDILAKQRRMITVLEEIKLALTR